MFARATFLGLLLLFAASCGGKQKQEFQMPGQTQLVVDSFKINGVNSVPLAELRGGLATKETTWRSAGVVRWMPVLGDEKHYFNYVQWKQDLERIRTFYYARGFYDARIVSENIRENPEDGTVSISITVSEGSVTKISEILIDGLEITDLRLSRVLTTIDLKKGEVFVEDDYLSARKQLRDELERAGYAYAEVEGRVEVKPRELSARVIFFVDPGPLSNFGDVEIVGTETVPVSAVRDALTFERGEVYSPDALQETQERIYDLGVFSVVKVSVEDERAVDESAATGAGAPDESAGEQPVDPVAADPNPLADGGGGGGGLSDLLNQAQQQAEQRAELDPNVKITIRVKEAKLWSVRVGAGVAAEIARQDAHGRLDWTSRNFLGGLRKLEHFNSAGYAWAPGLLVDPDLRNEGVIVDSELRFTQPQFIERFTKLETRLQFEREIEPGFTLISPTARISLRRKFFRFLSAELSYNFALYLLSNLNETLLDASLQLQPEYILEFLQQRIAYDRRNSLLNPTRGFQIDFQIQEATNYIGQIPGVPIGGNFDYVAPSLGFEAYIPYDLLLYQVLAFRARVGTIYNVGRPKQPPIPQRLYAGGADSMRSFGRQQLSLYSLEGEAIPVGGLTKAEASIEPRFRVVSNLLEVGDLWFAPFFDAGTVLPGALVIDTASATTESQSIDDVFDTLLYGVGAGAWWVTPVGPVRLDFAYTLSSTKDDPRFRRCAVPTETVGECPGEFVPLSEDPIQQRVRRWNIILGIGHSF